VFLIGIGPKSLEVQNEAVHPIGFIRRDEQPHHRRKSQVHPPDWTSISIFEGRFFKGVRQGFRPDQNWVMVNDHLVGKYQFTVINITINRVFQLFGNPSPNLHWIVYTVNDRANVLKSD
jgi:hypothetical protein